ncbi:MAG: hypothetical protein ABI986_08400 [Chloroflexota bacterium]
MLKLSTILMMLMCLLLGILIGIGVKTVLVKIDGTTSKVYTEQQQPKKIIVITFDKSHQAEFFAQMRKFADKWSFAIRIAPAGSDEGVYLIQMWREDIKVIAMNEYEPGRFSMGFFETYSTRPVSQQYFDEEVSDLESFIREIPGAKFSIEK